MKPRWQAGIGARRLDEVTHVLEAGHASVERATIFRFSDIPDARWEEVAGWLNVRIKAAEQRARRYAYKRTRTTV